MSPVTIDVTRLIVRGLQGRLPTGVDRVNLEYVRHFYAKANALVRFGGRWITLGGSDSRRLFDELLEPSVHFARMVRWFVGKTYVLRWKRPRHQLLFNVGHSGLHERSYAEGVRCNALRAVFFLHDLIPITHPEYCREGEATKHRQRLSTMISLGSGIVVNSNATLKALNNYAEQCGLNVPPCVVASLAPARLQSSAAERPLASPYFVLLGTIEPRKNHLLLLHVWYQLVEKMGENAPRLVIIGQRGWDCEQVVDMLERCEALRGIVIEKSQCSDAELSSWLFHAQALLFPSFIEGFGMPLVEALMLGVPVVASDLPVFREIAGDIPEYLDPIDGAGWRRLVLEYAQNDSLSRQAQCLRIKDYHAPTWAQHFDALETLLERVV